MLNTIVITKGGFWVFGNAVNVNTVMSRICSSSDTYLTIETFTPAEEIFRNSQSLYNRYSKYLDD